MKIIFWVDSDNETIELDDNMTEEEIQEEFDLWLNGTIHCGWSIEKED